jgi:hypothetical protein
MRIYTAIATGILLAVTQMTVYADGDDRQDRRQERGRSDERQDKRECRREEGYAGKDNLKCSIDDFGPMEGIENE